MAEPTRAVIPANPGWFLVRPGWEDKKIVVVFEEPIIAWVVGHEMVKVVDSLMVSAMPVIASGLLRDIDDWAIRHGGKYYLPEIAEFDDAEALIVEWNEMKAVERGG